MRLLTLWSILNTTTMRNLISILLALIAISPSVAQDSLNQSLVVGIKDTPPFVIEREDGSFTGVSVELWNQVAEELGVDFTYKKLELPQLIEALETHNVDLSINPLTVTSSRVKAFNFTQPFYITSLAIAVPTADVNPAIAFALNLFSTEFINALLLLFLVILIFGFLAWLFERKANPEEFESGWKGVWSGIWWSAVTMTTVGYGDKSPRSAGGRIVALVWMFTAIIIISGFTGSIASSLTVQQLGSDISGPDDLKGVKVATIKGSTSEEYLNNRGMNSVAFQSTESALKALADGDAEALVYDAPILKYLIHEHDLSEKIALLPHQFNTQYYSFSVSKEQRQLADQINPVLLNSIEAIEWKGTLNDYHLLD